MTDLLHVPRYRPGEAARLMGLSYQRVSRWVRGYEYRRGDHTVRQPPMVGTIGGGSASSDVSFRELIDLGFIKAFLDKGVSLQKVRSALTEAKEILGTQPHFAQRHFFTDGRSIYLQCDSVDTTAPNLLQLLSGGQWVIQEFILLFASQVAFDPGTGWVDKWFPMGREGVIVLNPAICGGMPTIAGTRVPTAVLFDMYQAEGDDIGQVAEWMHLEPQKVQAAVQFERRLAA